MNMVEDEFERNEADEWTTRRSIFYLTKFLFNLHVHKNNFNNISQFDKINYIVNFAEKIAN